ncbi:MAG: sulfate ABC transporter substrate-binding protein [Cyanobacteria bacterium]|nr:sulfate ABC transporter substrate-binding protein [Cyanobacteriota bacterium]
MGAMNGRSLAVKRSLALGLATIFLLGLVSCGKSRSDDQVEVTLVSFSVTKIAHEAIIVKFAQKWKQEHGQSVVFKRSYGGSGTQTRAVIDGLDADVVHLSLGLDMKKIEKAGLIQPGWETELPNGSIVSKSVAALMTRPGNPKGINDWNDLVKDGVQWITADPKTSGVARWNFLALWHGVAKLNSSENDIEGLVKKSLKNVPIMARDSRESSDVFFKQSQGDALINYENEVILLQQKGVKIDYTIPKVNISIDNPVAVVDKNVDKHGNHAVAEAFVQYLYSPEGQEEFAKAGFRPVNETIAQKPEYVARYPVVDLATVKDYGGWTEIQKKFFDDGAMFDRLRNGL